MKSFLSIDLFRRLSDLIDTMPLPHWRDSPNEEDRLLFDILDECLPGEALSPISELGILAFAEEQWGLKTLQEVALKGCAEMGEVADALIKTAEGRSTYEEADMEVGDVMVVLSQYAAKRGTTLDALRAAAYQKCRERASRKQGCAACDRGDFQLGHHDDCPKHPDNIPHEPGRCSTCGGTIGTPEGHHPDCPYREVPF
jgi:NTP pyrophosphatase (non-canonical NTP hydrolase)